MAGLIILAAGASRRLGKPKQNLIYKGETLLQRAVNTAIASECSPVVLVLGANADAIESTLVPGKFTIVINPDWQSGMASSVKLGINEIAKDKTIDAAVIMLCDQPFVTPELINSLLHYRGTTGKTIIGSAYKNTVGVPALFDRSVFNKLEELQGDEGARLLLKNQAQDVFAVKFDEGIIDIDTAEDYSQLDTD
ncbi:hypothetical protein A0256_22545 [Mucilaginibacter sp. PAMC 26640]|nr:hypothetical protein A0256_22545 [Mucilaginibacter sp. PAMC 26640]